MKRLLAFTMIALSLATGALEGKGPCTDDKLKFCKHAAGSAEAIRACLQQHRGELSGACEVRMQYALDAPEQTPSEN
jgi:hypothetical protein